MLISISDHGSATHNTSCQLAAHPLPEEILGLLFLVVGGNDTVFCAESLVILIDKSAYGYYLFLFSVFGLLKPCASYGLVTC